MHGFRVDYGTCIVVVMISMISVCWKPLKSDPALKNVKLSVSTTCKLELDT